ncbi:MAG TPA: hypothetical protein VLC09_13170 [Polyangiaceae bacterium]|nr:hypothetical protein [Polyangiaceae bacterium]
MNAGAGYGHLQAMNARTLRGASRCSLIAVGLATLCFSPRTAAAEEGAAAPEKGPAAPEEAPADAPAATGTAKGSTAGASASVSALAVTFDFDATGPDTEAVRRALEEELSVPVHAGQAERGLRLTVREGRLRAAFVPDQGATSEREMALPSEKERQVETIALLSGNLVRDEAADLLARLRRQEPAPVAVVAAAPPAEGSEQKPTEPPPEPKLPPAYFNLGLLSPLAIYPDLAEREAMFSLGIFYTDVGRVRGVAVDGLLLNNHSGGKGVQVAGLWSGSWGNFRGVRVAGLAETASGGQKGVQVAGLFAYQSDVMEGVQVAGLYNHAGERAKGVQAGLTNSAGDVQGVQIGLVNYAGGTVHGTQIGLINIGHGMKGAPVGLININPDVRVQAVAWGSARFVPDGNIQFSSAPMGHVGVKYTANHFYSLIGLGMGATEGCASGCVDEAVLAPGFGLGAHLPISGPLYVDLDGYYQWEISARSGLYGSQAILVRAAAGLELSSSFSVFAGAGPRLDIDPNLDEVGGSPHFFAGIQLF